MFFHLENILRIRNDLIGRLLAIVNKYIDRFSNSNTKRICQNRKADCDAIPYGSLILRLQKLELWPRKDDSAMILISVKDLAKDLQGIKYFPLPRRWP